MSGTYPPLSRNLTIDEFASLVDTVPRTVRNSIDRGTLNYVLIRGRYWIPWDEYRRLLRTGSTLRDQVADDTLPDNVRLRLVRPTTAMKRLGVSRSTLKRIIDEGELRAFDICQGGRATLRILEADLDDYLRIRRRPETPGRTPPIAEERF